MSGRAEARLEAVQAVLRSALKAFEVEAPEQYIELAQKMRGHLERAAAHGMFTPDAARYAIAIIESPEAPNDAGGAVAARTN